LSEPPFDGKKIVCLPTESRNAFTGIKPGPVRIEILETRSRKIRARTESESAAALVIAQSSYPAWQAAIDGRPTTIWTANFAFQAIVLPPGKHQIEFTYRDRGSEWGVVISALSAAGCAVGLWFLRSRQRRTG